MPSFLLTIFLVQLGIHLVNTVGAATFSETLWFLYNKLPTPTSSQYNEVVKLRREAGRLKRELDATSAQDQFAKWAKLQRQYDKIKANYDQKAKDIQSFESTFKTAAGVLRWLATNGLKFILQWWYGRVPMFWLPKGWVPSYIEWVLAFPKAPTGSVGIQMWFIASTSVVAIAAEGIAAIISLTMTEKEAAKKQPMKMSAAGANEKDETKKEL